MFHTDPCVDDLTRVYFNANCTKEVLLELITIDEQSELLNGQHLPGLAADRNPVKLVDELCLKLRVRNHDVDVRRVGCLLHYLW